MKLLIVIFYLVFLLSQRISRADHQYESTITELKHPEKSTEFKSNFTDNYNSLTSNDCRNNTECRRIANGHSAKACQFPFVAELIVKFESKRQGICTGSLIAPRWILTAKHCLFDIDDPVTTVIAIMGLVNRKINKNWQVRLVKNVVRLKHLILPDIALAELEDDFHLNNYVNIIKLPKVQEYKPSLEFVAVGWGNVLQYTSFRIYDTNECKNDIGIWSQFTFCSKGIDRDSSILSGDSGGPALIYNSQNEPILIGINVATKQDRHGNILWQLTTKIEPYLSWIDQHIRGF
ncbi:unnamed protein product [Chironomus riparius]|uniref:Peptidase S1 domain-containing protein n=1 Tax=Chironomus riparius TaxID=315576 RepID=A0A9N9S8A6_9DIPT|nr:unnamed protein product [Chironomus riparius]